jgi:hypothetical protein
MPISDPLELVVGDVRGQLRHRVDAEVATVRHDRGQHGADVFGRRLLALSRREEILGKAKLIVDFDQEVGQFHAAHVLRQPGQNRIGGSSRNHGRQSLGLPPNTDFDFFVIQVPTPGFGLSWYQGDIETNKNGVGHGRFIGRFNIETFIVSPAIEPSPIVFNNTFPDVSPGPKTGPIHTYHLGLWFNSPEDAKKAGGPPTVTPFNGEHNAGVQVLNTSNFPDQAGPLINIR